MGILDFLRDHLRTALWEPLRPVKRVVFRRVDFPRSVTALRIMENELYRAGASPVDVPARYRGFGEFSSIRPAQIRSEIQGLFEVVRDLKPKVVCEIGTALGGTFYIWCQAAADDALLISLDLPHIFNSPNRRDFYRKFARGRQELQFFPGDSHQPDSLSLVEKTLESRPVDFLFIDGDHTDAGVRKDFELYSPLVRKGGVVAFHDILANPKNPKNEVFHLWRELKARFPKHREIIETDPEKDSNANGIGIGIIWI